MTNPSESQRQRSQFNPLNLGTFDQTTLRLLTGSLGMRSQLINGGYGDYTYNHWFLLLHPYCLCVLIEGKMFIINRIFSFIHINDKMPLLAEIAKAV